MHKMITFIEYIEGAGYTIRIYTARGAARMRCIVEYDSLTWDELQDVIEAEHDPQAMGPVTLGWEHPTLF